MDVDPGMGNPLAWMWFRILRPPIAWVAHRIEHAVRRVAATLKRRGPVR